MAQTPGATSGISRRLWTQGRSERTTRFNSNRIQFWVNLPAEGSKGQPREPRAILLNPNWISNSKTRCSRNWWYTMISKIFLIQNGTHKTTLKGVQPIPITMPEALKIQKSWSRWPKRARMASRFYLTFRIIGWKENNMLISSRIKTDIVKFLVPVNMIKNSIQRAYTSTHKMACSTSSKGRQ